MCQLKTVQKEKRQRSYFKSIATMEISTTLNDHTEIHTA